MNKDKALERLSALESEAAQLRKIIEEPERVGLWRPEEGDRYYFVSTRGAVSGLYNTTEQYDKEVVLHCAILRDEETATLAAPSLRRANKIIQAGYEADADAGEFAKGRRWTALFYNGKWRESYCDEVYGRVIFVHTEEQARHMAAILNAEGVK